MLDFIRIGHKFKIEILVVPRMRDLDGEIIKLFSVRSSEFLFSLFVLQAPN